eukprot:1103933-Rhodomonas_salina.1
MRSLAGGRCCPSMTIRSGALLLQNPSLSAVGGADGGCGGAQVNHMVVNSALRPRGYKVTECLSGEAGLALIQVSCLPLRLLRAVFSEVALSAFPTRDPRPARDVWLGHACCGAAS